MSLQQLIYASAVPVSAARHGTLSVDRTDHGHCRHLNSVPLMVAEFAAAAAEYPIVFAQGADSVLPVAVLGARQRQNLFVDAQGRWQAQYLPAFVRRYPFVFADDASQRLTLCVDETCPGLNREGRGQALFTADGQPSAHVNEVLAFLQAYRAQFAITKAFCARLQALDLLTAMQAQFSLGTGERAALTGFLAVDRARLKALPANTLAELIQADALEPVYGHLQSLRNFELLKTRLAATAAPVADTDAPVAALASAAAEVASAAEVDSAATVA